MKHYHAIARKHFIFWKDNGKPKLGKVYEDMRSSRTYFKTALNSCKANEKIYRNKKLLDKLRNKNYKEFWTDVHNIKKHNDPQITDIDGKCTHKDIANMFSDKYQSIFNKKNKQEKIVNSVNMSEKKRVKILLTFSKNDVKKCIQSLRETIGFDKIHSKHLKFNSDSLQEFIAKLFSSFIIHNFLPSDMIKGIITPIVKNKLGNLCSSDNYRPIMNSSVFLKLFEYCLLLKIDPYISLNDRQHGFRKTYSTATAHFMLRETVLNYTQSHSCVYGCFLDISKAFDTVDHSIMINELRRRGVPACLVNIIEYWYNNQFVNVKFKDSLSEEWKIGNGVRQGGVLSGLLFSLYIDSLLNEVSTTNIGCKLGIISSNIIAYADDIVLLAPSANALRFLINLTNVLASKLTLTFNYEKTKIMIFRYHGFRAEYSMKDSFMINGHSVEVVKTIKYLGYIISDNMNCTEDVNRVKNKFYAEFNVILRTFNFADNDIKLLLFKQYCMQFYGSELWFGGKKLNQELKQFAVGYHKAIKKLIGLSTHESNHFACQEANLLLFGHMLNKLKISAFYRFMTKSCTFVHKTGIFLKVSSVLAESVREILHKEYDVISLFDNDVNAIFSRIHFTQNNETQMRESW